MINQWKEEALAAVNDDPKAKKAPAKEPPKKPAGGAKGGPDPDELKVSQFKINPCWGTVVNNGEPFIINIDFDA